MRSTGILTFSILLSLPLVFGCAQLARVQRNEAARTGDLDIIQANAERVGCTARRDVDGVTIDRCRFVNRGEVSSELAFPQQSTVDWPKMKHIALTMEVALHFVQRGDALEISAGDYRCQADADLGSWGSCGDTPNTRGIVDGVIAALRQTPASPPTAP